MSSRGARVAQVAVANAPVPQRHGEDALQVPGGVGIAGRRGGVGVDRALCGHRRQERVPDVAQVALGHVQLGPRGGDVGALIDVAHHVAGGDGALGETAHVHVGGDARLLRDPQRQAQRLARLAQGLVAVHQRGASVGRVLLRADHVEAVGGAERLLALADLQLLEGDLEAHAVDLRAALGSDDRDDLIGHAQGERALLVLGREAAGVFAQLVDADLVEELHVEERLLDLDAPVPGGGQRDGVALGDAAPGEADSGRHLVGQELMGELPGSLDARQVLREGDARLRLGLQDLVERDLADRWSEAGGRRALPATRR